MESYFRLLILEKVAKETCLEARNEVGKKCLFTWVELDGFSDGGGSVTFSTCGHRFAFRLQLYNLNKDSPPFFLRQLTTKITETMVDVFSYSRASHWVIACLRGGSKAPPVTAFHECPAR